MLFKLVIWKELILFLINHYCRDKYERVFAVDSLNACGFAAIYSKRTYGFLMAINEKKIKKERVYFYLCFIKLKSVSRTV